MTATRVGSIVPRAQQRVFAFLLAGLMVETLFFIVLSPLLPTYARELDLGKVGAGVLSACYAIGYGAAAVPAGAIVGVLGQRRVALGGLALVGIACACFAVGRDTLVLDGARTATGAGAAAVWAGSVPWLVSLGHERDRGRLIGFAFSAASAGACVGPAVGALATLTGPRATFLGLAAVILALAAVGGWMSRCHSPAPVVRPRRPLRSAVRAPGARRGLAMAALPSLGFGVAGVLLPLRLHALGVTTAGIAGAYLAASLLEAIGNPFVGRWYDRRGGRHVLRATLLGAAVCVAVLACPLPAGALLVAVALSFPILGFAWVPSLSQLSDSVERAGAQPGVALGLFNLCWAGCQTIGAVGGAQLARVGAAAPFAVLCVLYVLGTGAAGRLR